MADKLTPKTSIERGPPGEEPVPLEKQAPESLAEGGGDTAAMDLDANVGGASATRGLDSGGMVGVRRGRGVGRPGDEYESAEWGETDSDVASPRREEEEGVSIPPAE